MRISLLDPGLISLSGHHLDWDLRIVDELTSLGHRVEVFASNRVKPKVVALFSGRARLSPLFRFYPYTDPGEIDPIAGEVSVFLDGAALLVEDLRRIDECDLWFWPSLFAPQLHACSLVGRAPKIAGCIHIAPGFGAVTGAMWWRYAFLSAKRINLRANIGVTGPLLQKAYASLTASGQI
jgi:hypothetical protein